MSRADDTPSTIWLSEALALAVEALGSRALAKERLVGWLASGELPWSCVSWKGLDANGIAKLRQDHARLNFYAPIPLVAYREGGPEFWGILNLRVDWQDNGAEEHLCGGARALGIKVSRTHLLALLSTPKVAGPNAPTSTKAWVAWAQAKHPKERGERTMPYARRLHGLMPEALRARVKWTRVLRLLHG